MDGPPPALNEMFITSIDTLNGTEIDLLLSPGWNDRPPLLKERGVKWRKQEGTEDLALLKGMTRKGIPPILRCAVWLSNIVGSVHPHQPPSYSQEYRTLAKVRALDMAYESLLKSVLSNTKDDDPKEESTWQDMVTPLFGNDAEKYQENVRIEIKRVMIALDQVLGVVEYSPVLPTLCELFLTHMSESYAFCALREMTHAPTWYFPTYRREYAAWINAFLDILERLHPQTATFYQAHGVWTVAEMAPLFRDFFTTILPQKCVYRILDIYTLEGAKVIYRFGVALLCLFKMDQHSSSSAANNADGTGEILTSSRSASSAGIDNGSARAGSDSSESRTDDDFDVWKALKAWTHDERFNFDFLVKKAYGVHGQQQPRRFPRRNIISVIVKMEEERLLNDPSLDTSDAGPARPLGLSEPFVHPDYDRDELGEYTKKPPEIVLAKPTSHRISLASWLPLSLRMTKLQLLFSTNTHGRTLEMFYNRVKSFKHTVLLAEVLLPHTSGTSSDTNTIIGCYASQAWRISPQVYGDGECILFRLSPDPKSWKWSPRGKSNENAMEDDSNANVNANTASNVHNKGASKSALLEQFQVGTSSYISMGGNRDGTCGLRLNEDLTRAESAPAEGFNNEPLAGVEGDLQIGLVEVYGLIRPT